MLTVGWRLTKMLSEASTYSAENNPARGFYRIYTYELAADEAEEDWIWSLCRQERLALVLLDIGAAKDRRLTQAELAKAGRIFQLFADADMEMILRVAYDREGRGLEHEPKERSLIAAHMRQLGKVIRQYSNHFFTIQGLFIGSWGEMHDSAFLEKEDLLFLYRTLREATGDEVRIAVRKPQYQRMLADADGKLTVGLHDDAIFGSVNDMGTFGWLDDTENPDIMWTPPQELAFIAAQAGKFGVGGEILSGALEHPVTEVLQRLADMHVTYLNRVHEPVLWEQWDHSFVPDGRGGEQTISEYIGAHLGYSYLLKNVMLKEISVEKALDEELSDKKMSDEKMSDEKMSDEKISSEALSDYPDFVKNQDWIDIEENINIAGVCKKYQMTMQVHNNGFAPALDELMVELMVTDDTGQVCCHKMQQFSANGGEVIFELEPESELMIDTVDDNQSDRKSDIESVSIESGGIGSACAYKKQTLALWLRLFRKRDNRTIYFANRYDDQAGSQFCIRYDTKCENISCTGALFVGTLERLIEPIS